MKKFVGLFLICFFALTVNVKAKSAADVVVPCPQKVEMLEGEIAIKGSISLSVKHAEEVEAFFKKMIKEQFDLKVKSNSEVEVVINVDGKRSIGEEAYELKIEKNRIVINASNESGAFYGVQSLLQLMRSDFSRGQVTLSCQKIVDAPRFAWRSYMLDESRHFLGQKELYKLLDQLAELKINTLHWHLTDDAGWRLEIKKYPLLTKIGSKRADSEIETWGSGKTAGEPYEGYYTQKQVKEILAYAKSRHIKIIPEIEMPGHASASIAAYPWLGTKKKEIEVPVRFGKHYNIYDVLDPKVRQFLEDVVVEVIELFDTEVVHIGGDEVRFNHWSDDKKYRDHVKKQGYTSYQDVQIEFTNHMSQFIAKQGARMMGWNEILGMHKAEGESETANVSEKIASNVIVHFWQGKIDDLKKAAEQGYQLVNSFHRYTYLDYTYEKTPLEMAYSFDPIPEGLAPEYHNQIIGIGTQMWREWAPTVERLQEQTFPRVAAHAESGWSKKENKNYDSFRKRLKLLSQHWKNSGVNFYYEF